MNTLPLLLIGFLFGIFHKELRIRIQKKQMKKMYDDLEDTRKRQEKQDGFMNKGLGGY